MTQTKPASWSRNYMARKQAAIKTDIIIEERAFLMIYRHIGRSGGVIVVRKKDEERILSFLREYDTEIFVRKVKLTDDDLTVLGIK